jgi:uncharacterized protein
MLFASASVLLFHARYREFAGVATLPFDSQESVRTASVTHLALAGLLVGLGTEMSNGCTSGHGLCGMPRFSLRSWLAVTTFLSVALLTANLSLAAYIPEIPALRMPALENLSVAPEYFLGFSLVAALLLAVVEKSRNRQVKEAAEERLTSWGGRVALFFIGTLFGWGLMMAGMSQRSKIFGFLELSSSWDPSLLFVLMTGVLINTLTFNLIIFNVYHCPYPARSRSSENESRTPTVGSTPG